MDYIPFSSPSAAESSASAEELEYIPFSSSQEDEDKDEDSLKPSWISLGSMRETPEDTDARSGLRYQLLVRSMWDLAAILGFYTNLSGWC